MSVIHSLILGVEKTSLGRKVGDLGKSPRTKLMTDLLANKLTVLLGGESLSMGCLHPYLWKVPGCIRLLMVRKSMNYRI